MSHAQQNVSKTGICSKNHNLINRLFRQMLRKRNILDTFRHTHRGMIYCLLALTATKLVRLWINCKIWNGFSLSRLENKIVGGFRLFNIVKMLLFTTTFCRSTHLMIMKMMSKRDVTIILVVKSEKNY